MIILFTCLNFIRIMEKEHIKSILSIKKKCQPNVLRNLVCFRFNSSYLLEIFIMSIFAFCQLNVKLKSFFYISFFLWKKSRWNFYQKTYFRHILINNPPFFIKFTAWFTKNPPVTKNVF